MASILELETLFEALPFENSLHTPPTATFDNSLSQPPRSPFHTIENALKPFPRSLQIAHLNCESLPKDFHEFVNVFGSLNLHAICVTETWLSKSIPTRQVDLPEFVLYRNDRQIKRAGGVGIYIRKNLKSKVLSLSESTQTGQTEFIFLEVCVSYQKILLSVVYRPPNASFENFENELAKHLPLYRHAFVLGDVNYDLSRDRPDSKRFRDTVTSLDLKILPLNSTYHSGPTESWLDVMLTRCAERVLTHGQVRAPEVSPKHDITFLSYSLKVPKFRSKIIEYRDLKNINEAVLHQEASLLPFNDIFSLPDVNEKVHLLNALILTLYNKVAPMKRKRVKRPPSPWITPELLKLMAERDASFSRYKSALKHNSESVNTLFEVYRKLRNKCTQEVRNAKFKFSLTLEDPSLSPRALWKKLNTLGVGNSTQNSTDFPITANELNDHFCHIPPINCNLKNTTLHNISNLPTPPPSTQYFNFRQINVNIAEAAIKKIKSPAEGVDKISITLLCKILPFVIHPLTDIFNTSLRTGIFPSMWKLAHVKPIPKTQSPVAASDFRPISILPAVSKALEHIVHFQISSYVKASNLLDPFQSGFRSNHSTCTSLLKVTGDISEAMDNRLVTLLVLLDFSKAFQTVDHDILLAKLRHIFMFSTHSLSWLKSYLSDRQQCVTTANEMSRWKPINSGVPQGSVLGPLLFTMYTTDLPQNLLYLKYHMYADDLQCYISSPPANIESTINLANKDLSNIVKWSLHNGLAINPAKSQCILIGSQPNLLRLNTPTMPLVTLNGISLPYSTSVKNLGISINNHLTWDNHINVICKRAYSALHPLQRLKDLIPPTVKTRLVQTLVLSHLEYCDVLYDGCSGALSNKLQRIQNACVRYIFSLKRYDHLSQYYSKLNWSKLANRRKIHKLLLLYKIRANGEPSYLSNQFQSLSNSHALFTRASSTNILAIPPHKTDFYAKSFTVSAIQAWNALPVDVRLSRSLGILKRKLKELLH